MKIQKSDAPKIDKAREEKRGRKKRFLIVKLEERIAPKCHYNPDGKRVGCGQHQKSCYCGYACDVGGGCLPCGG